MVASAATPPTHALSLDPEATLAIALEGVVPIALFLATLQSDRRTRTWLVLLFVAIGTLSALLGVLQIATDTGYPYRTAHAGSSTGLFANRNHQADLVQMTMLVLCGWIGARRAPFAVRIGMLAVVLLFALLTVITTSRAGVALLALSVPASVLLLFSRRRLPWRLVLPTVAVAAALLAWLLTSDAFAQVFARFARTDGDVRTLFWRESLVAIQRSWPIGTGLGTFPAVYATIEDLDRIGAFLVNHAHNDYVEIVLEGGAFGALLIAAFPILLADRLWRIVRTRDPGPALGAFVAIGVVLLHSVVDYPLRTFTILAPFALLIGLLYPAADDAGPVRRGDRSGPGGRSMRARS